MAEKEKPRLARLTAILTQLQSKKLITASELANKHGISIRTVYRDIRTLEQSGVPIIMEEGRGYSLMSGYNLPPVMFSEAEAHALITAEQLIRKNKDESFIEEYQKAILKIKAVLSGNQQEKMNLLEGRLYVRTNYDLERNSNHLITVQSAITNYQLIDLDYRSENDKISNRLIEPFALYTTQENWILIAYCKLRDDFRAFRLDRIMNMTVLSECFAPHEITLQEYFDMAREKYLRENNKVSNTPDIGLSQE